MGALRLLLDTHAFIWWLDDDHRLSATARAGIADTRNTIYVSSATAWEMATKVRLGKLKDPAGAVPRLGKVLAERRMVELPITVAHAALAGSLPGPHRDPFDRMLIAQGRIEDLPLVTNDAVFQRYDVPVVW
ncbi:MAG TPA: type II toxin-antitoxin system VapC family toxin [Gemmatimonadales bacterium]|nr:type II toxin-antitoxin system VapC family toxin [Gemmatimonadales bacterium]